MTSRGNQQEYKQVSVVILTRNNERTIRDVIMSIKDMTDDLIIVDDGSTDSTHGIIKKIFPTANICQRSLGGDFSAQRNFGVSKTKHEWIFMIDSDEVVSPILQRSIKEAIVAPRFDAYSSSIKNYSLDRGNIMKLVRPILFKRHLRFKNKLHEQIVGVEFGDLPGHLDHLTWIDAAEWMSDMNTYSTNQAKKWIADGRTWGPWTITFLGITVPIFMFFKMYLWEGRWKRGKIAGLLYCLACAGEHRFALIKYYEMTQMEKQIHR